MKRRYFWFTRTTIHPHRGDMVFYGVLRHASRLCGVPFTYTLYVNKGLKLRWAWDADELEHLGKRVLKQCNTAVALKKHLKRLELYRQSALIAAQQVLNNADKPMVPKEIISCYDWLLDRVTEAHGLLNADVDAVDVVVDSYARRALERTIGNRISAQQFEQIYQQLVTPTYQSYSTQERIAIIKAALAPGHIRSSKVSAVARSFWWAGLGWESTRVRTPAYFKREVELAARRPLIAKHDLAKLLHEPRQVLRKRQVLIRRFQIPKSIVHWFELIDAYARVHDQRKEMQVKTMYAFHVLLLRAARILGVAVADLEWLRHNEVQAALRHRRVNKKLIAARKRLLCIEVTKRGIEVLRGSRAKAAYLVAQHSAREKLGQIKGTPVMSGIVRGIARVCHGSADALRKVRVGQVLVCGMTLPDYVPAMKKAAAIVTDEGGTTSHAAIIARELGKPCIVGTKIATQVLKDGDLVEVDANKGVVRKL